MNSAIFLLQEIAMSTQRATAITRAMMVVPRVCHNPYTYRLIMLLQDIYRHSISTIQNLQVSDGKEEIKNSAHIMYEAGSAMDEMHIMLRRTLTEKIPEYLKQQLNSEVHYLLKLLTDLVPYMTQIFGDREVLFVVAPEFQAKSELW